MKTLLSNLSLSISLSLIPSLSILSSSGLIIPRGRQPNNTVMTHICVQSDPNTPFLIESNHCYSQRRCRAKFLPHLTLFTLVLLNYLILFVPLSHSNLYSSLKLLSLFPLSVSLRTRSLSLSLSPSLSGSSGFSWNLASWTCPLSWALFVPSWNPIICVPVMKWIWESQPSKSKLAMWKFPQHSLGCS